MRSGRLYENITQTIANVCGDWGDHDRLDRPCSLPLASLSLLRRKTAITEKMGGHEEGCYCQSINQSINFVLRGLHITVFRLTNLWPSDSRSNWTFAVLIFVEGGKPENPEKNPRSKDENQQQTQPTYDAGSGNRTRATLVGGERSHHCAIPLPQTAVKLTAVQFFPSLQPHYRTPYF